MRGIINSELNPEELIVVDPKTNKVNYNNIILLDSLKDRDYLIALLQKSFFDNHRYDIESEAWENVTPAEYIKVMSEALNNLEDKVCDAFDFASGKINALKASKEILK